MAFFDSFWKKIKYYTDTSAKNAVSEINEYLAETNERLHIIETRQKETIIQLEEIDDFLQNNGNENVLIDTLIALTDTIGDFYFFAAVDRNSPLFEQAQMMWNRAKSAVEAVGLKIIEANNVDFDFHLHSAESTEQNMEMQNGYVINTLKFGYIYKDKVLRRAAVIVNKLGTPNNIIYL
ncbi:nucleotide exchange factor GrpE [Treponema sp. R80B11-R83G3]